jgi:hypothetical protein
MGDSLTVCLADVDAIAKAARSRAPPYPHRADRHREPIGIERCYIQAAIPLRPRGQT